MKTTIHIKGQPQGNNALLRSFNTANCDVQQNFNNYSLTYRTKREALQEIKLAFSFLIDNEFDAELTRYNHILYDASSAGIYDPTIY